MKITYMFSATPWNIYVYPVKIYKHFLLRMPLGVLILPIEAPRGIVRVKTLYNPN